MIIYERLDNWEYLNIGFLDNNVLFIYLVILVMTQLDLFVLKVRCNNITYLGKLVIKSSSYFRFYC